MQGTDREAGGPGFNVPTSCTGLGSPWVLLGWCSQLLSAQLAGHLARSLQRAGWWDMCRIG